MNKKVHEDIIIKIAIALEELNEKIIYVGGAVVSFSPISDSFSIDLAYLNPPATCSIFNFQIRDLRIVNLS